MEWSTIKKDESDEVDPQTAAMLAMVEAAALRSDLKVVKLDMDKFSLGLSQALTKCIGNNKGIREIWLSASSADDEAQAELVATLKSSSSLKHVHIKSRGLHGGGPWSDSVKHEEWFINSVGRGAVDTTSSVSAAANEPSASVTLKSSRSEHLEQQASPKKMKLIADSVVGLE